MKLESTHIHRQIFNTKHERFLARHFAFYYDLKCGIYYLQTSDLVQSELCYFSDEPTFLLHPPSEHHSVGNVAPFRSGNTSVLQCYMCWHFPDFYVDVLCCPGYHAGRFQHDPLATGGNKAPHYFTLHTTALLLSSACGKSLREGNAGNVRPDPFNARLTEC